MKTFLTFLSIWFLVLGCTEEIVIEDNGFESILVVESTITDNLENQTVKLSRTSKLNDTLFQVEQNAIVTVNEGNTTYNFTSIGNGRYLSDEKFSAKENLDYQLNITTQNGKNILHLKYSLNQYQKLKTYMLNLDFPTMIWERKYW